MISSTAWNWGAKSAFFYAGTNFICLAWCWFRLPETKDRTFGEIDLLFENKIPARKFRTTAVDRELDQMNFGSRMLISPPRLVEFAAGDKVARVPTPATPDLEKKQSIVHDEFAS